MCITQILNEVRFVLENFEIPLVTEADLKINGNVNKNSFSYMDGPVFLNKTFEHTYTMSKSLNTPISGASIEVLTKN